MSSNNLDKKKLTTVHVNATPDVMADLVTQQTLKRNRKNNRTRRHFTEEAVILFEKNGFSATTVEEIAEAADYSTSTFFRLFSDKEGVVFYDFLGRLEDLKSIFTLEHSDNTWVGIRNTFIRYAQLWDNEEGEQGIRRLRVIYSEPVLYARFLAKVAGWEDYMAKLLLADFEENPNKDMASQVIAGAASTAFRAGLRAKLENSTLSLTQCVTTAFDQLEKISGFFQVSLEAENA